MGRESVGNFASELYQLQIIASRAKDPKFTEYTPALQTAMMQEIPAMFQAIVFDRNASALELLTTRNTFVTKELAALYGLPTTGLSSTALTAATLPADGLRAGLLTTAGFLSLYANQEEGSPTQRGKFIRQTILCEHRSRSAAQREHGAARPTGRRRVHEAAEAERRTNRWPAAPAATS